MIQVDTSALIRRICEHLGIAYSANRILPALAELERDPGDQSDLETLNSLGGILGLRFREMSGTSQDLASTVCDSGPVLVRGSDNQDPSGNYLLVLSEVRRNRFLVNRNGVDQTISIRQLRRLVRATRRQEGRWILVQPMLAAEHASRIHYQSGTQSEPLKPLRRLIALLKPEAQDIRTIVIFSVVTGLLSLTTPLAVEAVVNTIAFGRYLQPLIVLSLIVMIFLGFRAGLNVMMTVVAEVIQRKLFVRTVEDLSYRLTRVPLSKWKSHHGPELVNRFFDIVNVQKITSKLLLDSLMLLLQTLIGLSVVAFYHPFLLGYDIGLLVLMTVVLTTIGRGAVKTAKEESNLKYSTAAWLQEIVRHPSTFKFNGGLGYAINRADELTSQYIHHRQRHFQILIRQISFSMFMQVVAATVLLALGGFLVIDGQMNLGQLVAAELIVTVILGSFAKLGKDLESFYDLLASVDKLGKLFDLPVEPVNKLQIVRKPGAYGVSLVSFRLDEKSTSPVDLQLEPGQTYAISGSSELRRSRLIEAMIGQCRPAAGHVLLDDYRVDSIRAESLQDKVSLIRDIEIFDGTVDENLRMGREQVGSGQINEFVEKLGLQRVIDSLEAGYSTPLSVNGYPLSTGDAVRLVLARSLVSKPGILFIDGLLDRLSDQATVDVLNRLQSVSKTTTLVIATGRGVIANWAFRRIDLSRSDLGVSDFND